MRYVGHKVKTLIPYLQVLCKIFFHKHKKAPHIDIRGLLKSLIKTKSHETKNLFTQSKSTNIFLIKQVLK
jgi:hypothetical protein